MAERISSERVVELIEQFLEKEDYPESIDDEIDRHIRYDFLDEETGEPVIITNLPTSATSSSGGDETLPFEKDSLLLFDKELVQGGHKTQSL